MLRIGCGSAYSDDRLEPVLEMLEVEPLDYLCFDCLAERTLILAQQRKQKNPAEGYDTRLEEIARRVLPVAHQKGVKIIGNMGAANPEAGAARIRQIAAEAGWSGLKVAAITGDDLSATFRPEDYPELAGEHVLSATAYIGVEPVVEALRQGADVVVAGRLADPSLFLAPMVHRFGWSLNDWGRLSAGTIVGHLLECGVHVTGGNFADPPYRVVPDLDRLGMPLAEVEPTGQAVITKTRGTGGLVSVETCKTQLSYEILDPAGYITPDVTVDLTEAVLEPAGPDRVRVRGVRGLPRPERLKVLVGVKEGFMGEGEVSFAGPGALSRATLCADVLRARLGRIPGISDLRLDLIGINSLHDRCSPPVAAEPYEVRVRAAARTSDPAIAKRIGDEVEYMFIAGPAAAGGARKTVRELLGMRSVLVPRRQVELTVTVVEVEA